MKKWLIAALALALAVGYAQVNFPSGGDLDGNVEELWDAGDGSAAVRERVRVVIPPRYALHLTEDEWDLNLNTPPEAPGDWSYSPANPVPPEGCYLVPKRVKTMQELRAFIEDGGVLRPIGTYPAARDYNNDGRLSNDEKGTLLCVNHKILQKFSNNPDGWRLSVSVTGNPASGFGWFALADQHNLMSYFATNNLPSGPHVVAQGNGPTGGWLDDLIVEAFWFDGSERHGNYTIDVTFTLAGL
jgi:hypothetical protein